MKYLKIILIFFTVLVYSGCNDLSRGDLIGSWEAVSVSEAGRPLEVDYPLIRLDIMKDGTYNYQGTLNYREAGKWHIKSHHLYTIDTLKPGATEKAVLISSLTRDSFELKMSENEIERIMKMVRIVSE